MVASMEGFGEGIVRDGQMHTAIFKVDNTTQTYCIAHWNSAQCYVTAWIGREFGGE